MKSGRVLARPDGNNPGVKRARSALEKCQYVLRVGVRNRHGLDAQLLLNLERLETGRFLVHVGIDELADTTVNRVHQLGDEVLLQVDLLLGRAKDGGGVS